MTWFILICQMTSPQWDYDYPDLIKYLNMSKTALANFEAQYPDLSFDYAYSWDVSSKVINDVFAEFNDGHQRNIAYLEEGEDSSAATLGSRHRFEERKRWKRAAKKLDKIQATFADRLRSMIQTHDTYIKTILFEMETMSALFTQERIDKHQWHLEWVAKQEVYVSNYFLHQCRQYSPSKNLDMTFVDNPDDIPKDSGVYFLFKQGELAYIGHSSNLRQRVKGHELVRKYYSKDADGVYNIECVFATLPISEAKEVERNLLLIAKPPDNKKGIDL